MASRWLKVEWQTCPGGVSSAVAPPLLPPGQYAWGFDIAVRGGKPHTRGPFVERLVLPSGLHQCTGYFGVQAGMLVTYIGGRIYRIRIGSQSGNFSWENIPLPWPNSARVTQAWMQQTVESLVIQDGQSAPIIYNGSTAARATSDQVPRGRMMAYGNGRLWVAINKNELVAGDIRTRTPGSELYFTETNYLSGGGSLYFQRGLTGLEFIPITGAADFGTLIVFGADYAESIRADVTSRDAWAQMAGFVTNVFRDIGCAGDWSIVMVNQDLYWRDSHGNIRSLANSISTNNTPGSTPISREVSRLVGFDSESLLPFCSGVYFDNRLLMTASPYLNANGGVSFENLVSLDFAPISTMQFKSPPAYDGQWTGLPGINQIVTGQFNGANRAFVITTDETQVNRLWEILPDGRDDLILSCGSGEIDDYPIQSFVEYPAVNYGDDKQRKRLERLDVWVTGLVGHMELTAYWRADNTQKWSEWDAVTACAINTDAATAAPHVWKNLLPQQRPQIKTFTIPDNLDAVTKYAAQVGFQFQIRLAWRGKLQIDKVLLHAMPLDDQDYADRTALTECVENDVTGNEITYEIVSCRPNFTCLIVSPTDPLVATGLEGGPFDPSTATYLLTNVGTIPMDWTMAFTVDWLITDGSSAMGGNLLPGDSTTVTVDVAANDLAWSDSPYTGQIVFTNVQGNDADADCAQTLIDAAVTVNRKVACIAVSPTDEWVSTGPEGAPFDPDSQTYTVSNTGTDTLYWELDPTEAWFITDGSAGGILEPGQSKDVLVTLDADALPQQDDPYTAILAFNNLFPITPPMPNDCGRYNVDVSLLVTVDSNVLMESRTFGGTASLIGCSEFTDASTPPKKYRRLEQSGATYSENWPAGIGCVGDPTSTDTCNYSKWLQYDAVTGDTTHGGETECNGSHDTSAPACMTLGELIAASNACVSVWTADQTTAQRAATNVCCNLNFSSSYRISVSDTLTDVLSDEDTDADALARLIAASSWSSWTVDSAIGDALSQYQVRTTGFDYTYEQAQYRLTKSGLTPSHLYHGTASVYRRVWGSSDPWTFDSSTDISATTDGSGNYTFTDTLPITAGYEYTVWNALLTV